jgi:hypothetical protein
MLSSQIKLHSSLLSSMATVALPNCRAAARFALAPRQAFPNELIFECLPMETHFLREVALQP